MRASNESRVERDQIHEHAETELLLKKLPGDGGLGKLSVRIEKEFHGVVTGLPMDIDTTREVRSPCVILPIIVGEPASWIGHQDEVARSRVVQPSFLAGFPPENAFDTTDLQATLEHAFKIFRIPDIDVGDLVISDGKGLARTGVENLQSHFVFDGKPSLLAKDTIDVNGLIDRRDPVFR